MCDSHRCSGHVAPVTPGQPDRNRIIAHSVRTVLTRALAPVNAETSV